MDKKIRTQEGESSARGLRFGIVASRFNDFIVDRLVDAAISTLIRHGADPAEALLVRVPGAFETPLALQKLAQSRRYDALIALGCVIRGATPHFDIVVSESAAGVSRVSLDTGIPIGLGILTVDTIEQAIERAGTKAGNKGVDAALAAIEMANLLRQLEQ